MTDAPQDRSSKDPRGPDFLTGLGHALRTPLNGILGMSELLIESELSPRQRQFASAIHESGIALLELSKDVLDLSRLESGELKLDPQPFSPAELLRNTARAFLLRAQAKRLEIQVYAEDLPPRLEGDMGRLRQVVAHLISNALVQTERGRIAIAADVTGEEAGRVELRVRVTDTGRGIPEEARDRVFDPFSRLGASTSGQPVGSGLALALAKRTTEAMGGTMGFESWEGSGATFWLRLPLEKLDAADAEAGSEEAGAETKGGEGRWTSSGAFFVGRGLESAAFDQTWPEISADTVMMADADPSSGASEDAESGSPDTAATAARPGAEKAEERTGDEATPMDPERAERAEKRILVVEDNPVNQLLAVHQLKFLGYGVEAVGDGAQALELLDRQPFDLVLMDCELPDLDGYETTRRLRASESRARLVPIVAITAHADEGQRERCLQAGMNDYLAKPYREKDLLGILSKNLRRA